MARDAARALDRKGARRDKGPALAVAIVLASIVAAVGAAGLMVWGVQALGSASSQTAEAATDVPGRVVVHASHAVRDGATVSEMHLFVGTDGAAVDLAALEVRVERTAGAQSFRYGGAMDVDVQRDADGSTSAPAPTLNRGDLVDLVLHLEGSDLGLAPGDTITVRWGGSAADTPPLQGRLPTAGAGTIMTFSLS